MSKNWLFLRGAVPTDRDPREIEHDTLEQEDDMWIHLFSGLVGADDFGHVVYYGAEETKAFCYRDNFAVWHYPDLSKIIGQWDYIFARGGFPIYDALMARLTGYKIYYGAGKRYCPPAHGYTDYDLVLVDSDRQRQDVSAIYQDMRCKKIIKPAAPLFYPRDVEKKFDCCFVAGVANPCKMVQWVYDTVPRDISVLQLGYTPEGVVMPPNVTVRRVPRWEMPQEMCRCRVGIVPYGSADSCPRVIPEFLACGVWPVICDEVNYDGEYKYKRENLWETVQAMLYSQVVHNSGIIKLWTAKEIREEVYNENYSMPIAVNRIKKIIGEK